MATTATHNLLGLQQFQMWIYSLGHMEPIGQAHYGEDYTSLHDNTGDSEATNSPQREVVMTDAFLSVLGGNLALMICCELQHAILAGPLRTLLLQA